MQLTSSPFIASATVIGLVFTIGFMALSDAQAADHCDDMRHQKGPHVTTMDTDNDQRVSREEFLSFHVGLFNQMDQNKDGQLTEAEFKLFHDKCAPPKKHDDD